MKIFFTTFIFDGVEYEGPVIFANNTEEATLMAEANGLQIESEVEDVAYSEKTDSARTDKDNEPDGKENNVSQSDGTHDGDEGK